MFIGRLAVRRSAKYKMNIKHIYKIAEEAHSGQFRRDGKTPYITHPLRIAQKIRNKGGSETHQAVALLKDCLDKTKETRTSMILKGVPEEVVDAVEALTKTDRSISYAEYLREVKKNPLAREVKVQDILDNLSDSPSPNQIMRYSIALLDLHGIMF